MCLMGENALAILLLAFAFWIVNKLIRCIVGFLQRKRELQWWDEFQLTVPTAHALDIVGRVLYQSHACELMHMSSSKQALSRRGAPGMRTIPNTGGMAWGDIPVVIVVWCYPISAERTSARIIFSSNENVYFAPAAARWFRKMADQEFREIVQEARQALHHESRPVTPPPEPDLSDAYALLNLKPGSPWSEVQAAYRAACKRYHPDRLIGQNLPPQGAELAVRKFKDMTDAYQALKQHLAA